MSNDWELGFASDGPLWDIQNIGDFAYSICVDQYLDVNKNIVTVSAPISSLTLIGHSVVLRPTVYAITDLNWHLPIPILVRLHKIKRGLSNWPMSG